LYPEKMRKNYPRKYFRPHCLEKMNQLAAMDAARKKSEDAAILDPKPAAAMVPHHYPEGQRPN
jgi:hypothetical protein